ncbi:hypothetical protein SH528x_003559 [Novipirellula sp. SH528]|uniref:hypothetical protein n=1 Tax=Novipirellula sp. SH528 TaxID=3454466 RepID=UPI003F9FF856
MLQFPDDARFRHSYVVLVFRSIIVDRAGEMPWCRPVAAEIVETDIAGTAFLLTSNRTHLQFPVRALHKPTESITRTLEACSGVSNALQAFGGKSFSYIGGQEIIWDIHNAVTPAVLRHLTLDEITEALQDPDALVDSDA